MTAPKHTPPELEAVELEAVGWFVRTKRTNEDSAGWLIADCSTATHGREWATLFAASQKMREALYELLQESVVLSAEYLETFRDWPDDKSIQGWEKGRWKRALVASENARAALAAAEGRTEEKEG